MSELFHNLHPLNLLKHIIQSERLSSVALTALAVLCMALALHWQVSKDWAPCALCVMQRMGYLIAIVGFALKAFGHRKTGNTLAAAGSLSILWFAFSHLSLMSKPKQGCSFDSLGMAINDSVFAQYAPFVFESQGTCWQTDISVMGLHLSSWSALIACVFLMQIIASMTSSEKTK